MRLNVRAFAAAWLYARGLNTMYRAEARDDPRLWRRALWWLNRACRVVSDFAPFYVAKGHCHLCLEEYRSARYDYERILTLDPGNRHAKSELAQLYGAAGEFDRAADLWNDLIRAEPDNFSFRMLYGMACGDGGRFHIAIDCFRKVLSFESLDPEQRNFAQGCTAWYRELQMRTPPYLELGDWDKPTPVAPYESLLRTVAGDKLREAPRLPPRRD